MNNHAAWVIVADVATLRRDPISFAKVLLIRSESRNICVPGSTAHTQYRYWTRFFNEIVVHHSSVAYKQNGRLHRTDGPAVEHRNGTKEWWYNNQRHRTNGPAVLRSNGCKEWWFENKRHRSDGPAVEYLNGDEQWWFNGKLHREDGPAVVWVYTGKKEWWIEGELHRIGGPAVEYGSGKKEYWYKGVRTLPPVMLYYK